jgi:hypothetical protein
MPAQKRLRSHYQLAPPTREQSGERREESTIGRPNEGRVCYRPSTTS